MGTGVKLRGKEATLQARPRTTLRKPSTFGLLPKEVNVSFHILISALEIIFFTPRSSSLRLFAVIQSYLQGVAEKVSMDLVVE
jgi:hypothetical protein